MATAEPPEPEATAGRWRRPRWRGTVFRNRRFRAFERAVGEAGIDVRLVQAGQPSLYLLDVDFGSGPPTLCAVFLWRARRGRLSWYAQRRARRVWERNRPAEDHLDERSTLSRAEASRLKQRTVLLGYDARAGVFVIWERERVVEYRARGGGAERSVTHQVRVPADKLGFALVEGIDALPLDSRDDEWRASMYSVEDDDSESWLAHSYERPDFEPSPPPEPVVETGFALAGGAEVLESWGDGLEPETPYLFWFAVGAGLERFSIETDPSPLPETPDGAVMTVQLFAFPGELELRDPRNGTFALDAEGRSVVVDPAEKVRGVLDPHRVLGFVVRTPAQPMQARLRCNVYLGSTLLQSRLVTATVGQPPPLDGPALAAELDYALTERLDGHELARVPEHAFSLMVNGAGSSHQLRFFSAADGRPREYDASLDALALDGAIDDARGALREVAWDSPDAFDPRIHHYRYARARSFETVAADLKRLASHGRGLYLPILLDFTGGDFDEREALEAQTATTSDVQVALPRGGLYVPAGLFYDHDLSDSKPFDELHLCPHTEAALRDHTPLEDIACFGGRCAEADDPTSVCVSGFWGYRHNLGWPLPMPEPLTELRHDGRATMTIGVSLEASLRERDDHVERVRVLATSSVARSVQELTVALTSEGPPNVVYLYCHGGVIAPGTPFVEVGMPGSERITGTYFTNYRVRFRTPKRPLVFINGCHTTALSPRQVMNLADGFVREGNAVGVIGTEITVFEPLAVAFAEETLKAFLDGSHSIGSAIRLARLRLLDAGNPLGLAYVPFVAAPTRLVAG